MTSDNNTRVQEALLPWLANDTLQGDERARVVQYANKNLEGRRQLRQWQALAEQMPDESYGNQAEDLAWARLNRALDCETESQLETQSGSELDCQPDQQVGQNPHAPSIAQLNSAANRRINWRWAAPITRGQLAASFAAIAAIGFISTLALTLTLQPHPSQPFTTLSAPQSAALAAGEVAVRLALEPSAGLAVGSNEFDVFLKMRGASLLSYSAQAGVVTVRVTSGTPFSDPARWQQEASILFAEPVK